MPNPYPATFEVAENLHVRLDGDVTFTDPANQPGGGGGGQVNSVTAGDASITIAGTVTDPTVAVAALGVTSGKIASNAVTQAKLAAKAVGAAQMDSGAASANWVPVADGSGGVVYAASPGVNSLTAADTSIVVGGTASSPTVRTGTLDTIATQHPPTAAVALNSQKITGLANGTVSNDAAAFGQIPTALPPNGSAGGDLSGTYPNPTVAAVQGVAVSGTAPTANQVLTASDATHAAWATPTGSSPLTTKGDLFGHSTVDARIPVGTDGYVLLADSGQTLGVGYSTRDVALNTHKITGLTEGAASGEAATYSATPAGIVTTKGDVIAASGSHAVGRLGVGSDGQVLTADSAQTLGVKWSAAAGGGAWTLITSGTLGSSAANIDITSISSSYNHLYLLLLLRGTASALEVNVNFTFNADTAAHYDAVEVYGNSGSAGSGSLNGASAGRMGNSPANTASAGEYAALSLLVPFYAATNANKISSTQGGRFSTAGTSTTYTIDNWMNSWRSTAAVNEITITPSAGSWASGSAYTLHGIT